VKRIPLASFDAGYALAQGLGPFGLGCALCSGDARSAGATPELRASAHAARGTPLGRTFDAKIGALRKR
jgi:hypothetical protein